MDFSSAVTIFIVSWALWGVIILGSFLFSMHSAKYDSSFSYASFVPSSGTNESLSFGYTVIEGLFLEEKMIVPFSKHAL
jgi:hypothetical protein